MKNMKSILKPRITYTLLSILFFIIEYLIETNLKSGFIRFYVGDYLAAILLYTILMTIVKLPYKLGITIILLFCYLVEFSQWLQVLDLLNMSRTRLTDVLLGSTFSWLDILCYTLGILTVFIIEYKTQKHS